MRFGFALLFFACNQDKPIETNNLTDTATIPSEEGCTQDDDCDQGYICEVQDCIPGDRNNSLEEAESLLWESSISGIINPEEDVDYYTFNAEGGEYVRLYTITDIDEDDTVVVLRDPNGKVITWSDDYPTGSSISSKDSILFAFLAEEGTHVISVEDYGSYFGNDPSASSSYGYSLYLEEWSRTTREDDSMENPLLGIDMETTNMWDSVGISIAEEGDHDFFAINYSAESPILEIHGQINLDGSDLIPSVRLYNPQGALVVERNGVGIDGIIKYPFMETGSYLVEIFDQGGLGSLDHWTFLYPISRENTSEQNPEIEPNTGTEEASPLVLNITSNSNGNEYGYGYAGGTLLSEDEDWFSIENPYDGGTIVMCMNSALYGSTLLPAIDVYDAQGTLLDTIQSDSATDPNAAINEIPYDAGTYYVRVYSEMPITEDMQSNWYQFITYAASFAPSSYSCP
jgi:hypothetical protein